MLPINKWFEVCIGTSTNVHRDMGMTVKCDQPCFVVRSWVKCELGSAGILMGNCGGQV